MESNTTNLSTADQIVRKGWRFRFLINNLHLVQDHKI